MALVYPGDLAARRAATPANNRFAALFTALAERGAQALPAVYHDEFRDQVRAQLLGVDCALVWVNPLQDGRDRAELDALLREVAAAGVAVSTHPDVILAMGTKEVLHRTRDLGWGGDTRLYRDPGQLRRELPEQLAAGAVRVLKQLRGNGGSGVWKVEAASPGDPARVRVRHAQRGAVEQEIPFEEFLALCAPYFAASGGMVDQAWQPRLVEGTVRCYLVHDRVAGFG
ncbi:MAG TPA: Cj0069 family protein, partial [Gammaproteobacteria bacterium]